MIIFCTLLVDHKLQLFVGASSHTQNILQGQQKNCVLIERLKWST